MAADEKAPNTRPDEALTPVTGAQQAPDYGGSENHFFISLLGAKIVVNEKGGYLTLAIGQRHLQPNGVVHGGVIFTLADTAAGLVIQKLTRGTKFIATVEAKINFVAPAAAGELIAEASVTHQGNTLVVVEVKVTNRPQPGAEGRVVAIMLGTFITKTPRGSV